MFNKIGYILGGIVILMAVFMAGDVFDVMDKPEAPMGSVAQTGEYHATTTNYGGGISCGALIKSGWGTLGSVVLTTAASARFDLMDATTTNALLRAAAKTTSSLIMASFPASTAVGVYTFDINFADGLMLSCPAAISTTTITFR